MTVEDPGAKGADAPSATTEEEETDGDRQFGAALAAIRVQAGLSQRDVGRRMGLSQSRVAHVELARNVSLKVLAHYLDALGAQLEVRVVKGNKTLLRHVVSPRKVEVAPPPPRRRVSFG